MLRQLRLLVTGIQVYGIRVEAGMHLSLGGVKRRGTFALQLAARNLKPTPCLGREKMERNLFLPLRTTCAAVFPIQFAFGLGVGVRVMIPVHVEPPQSQPGHVQACSIGFGISGRQHQNFSAKAGEAPNPCVSRVLPSR